MRYCGQPLGPAVRRGVVPAIRLGIDSRTPSATTIADQPDLPAREFEHQSFAGFVLGAVSTWLMVDLIDADLDALRDLDLGLIIADLGHRPRMPPPVMTSSPFFTAAIAA